jgi:hypothetical protein
MIEQHRDVLDQWDCHHFWCGLRALRTGNFERVEIEVEYALTPSEKRGPAAQAKVEFSPTSDRYSVAIPRCCQVCVIASVSTFCSAPIDAAPGC